MPVVKRNPKQQLLSVIVGGIPGELKRRKQWVVWKRATRKGKSTKIPHDPKTGNAASTTDPKTWGTFEEALAAYKKAKTWDGIGFVFTADDPYVGIDLDGCLDPTSKKPKAFAKDVIELLSTYCEISPSGTGLHLIAKGELPPGRRRNGPVEMYDQGRYFCITGHRLKGSVSIINACTKQLKTFHEAVFKTNTRKTPRRKVPPRKHDSNIERNALNGHRPTDAQVLHKARTSRNGKGLQELLEGNSNGYASASEADPQSTFYAWIKKAEDKTCPKIYRDLREKISKAGAAARSNAEIRVFRDKPFEWLRYGPGRSREGSPSSGSR